MKKEQETTNCPVCETLCTTWLESNSYAEYPALKFEMTHYEPVACPLDSGDAKGLIKELGKIIDDIQNPYDADWKGCPMGEAFNDGAAVAFRYIRTHLELKIKESQVVLSLEANKGEER